MDISEMTVDPTANLQIRPTDNDKKDCDGDTVHQKPILLDLDETGVPIGWVAPEDGE